MGTIIGVCNQKGGTGKTTTAINLSAYLGVGGEKTLLIDMDPQGNATSGVGFDSSGKNTIYGVLMGKNSLMESVYPTEWPCLHICPSDVSLTGGEVELVNMENREQVLSTKINEAAEAFSYIVIDAPPSLGLLTVNVLGSAQELIVPVQCEYYALEGVSKITQTVELIRQGINPGLSIRKVLLTMADFRTRLTLQVIEEVRNFFGPKAGGVIISRNVKLAEAPSFGKPIHFYDSNCVGAKAYLTLAQEVLGRKIDVNELAKEQKR